MYVLSDAQINEEFPPVCVLVFPCVLSQNRQGNLVHTRKFGFPVVSKRDVILIYFPLEPKWEINSFSYVRA